MDEPLDTVYLRNSIDVELSLADADEATGDLTGAFTHLERAHVLGQSLTYDHTFVHWRMLKLGWKMRSPREVFGQVIRILGAATKTPFGIYPAGNTGGANVWFFKRMTVPEDLREIIQQAKLR